MAWIWTDTLSIYESMIRIAFEIALSRCLISSYGLINSVVETANNLESLIAYSFFSFRITCLLKFLFLHIFVWCMWKRILNQPSDVTIISHSAPPTQFQSFDTPDNGRLLISLQNGVNLNDMSIYKWRLKWSVRWRAVPNDSPVLLWHATVPSAPPTLYI